MTHHVVIECHLFVAGFFTGRCETCGWRSPSVPEDVAVRLAAEHVTETEKEAA